MMYYTTIEEIKERTAIKEQVAVEIFKTIKEHTPVKHQTVEEIKDILNYAKIKLRDMNVQL